MSKNTRVTQGHEYKGKDNIVFIPVEFEGDCRSIWDPCVLVAEVQSNV